MSSPQPSSPKLPPLPLGLRVLHWVFIINFIANIVYGAYQLFVVLAPEGGSVGPLWGAAKSLGHEQLMARRAYASEVWLSIVGLSLYLAITEYLPRRAPWRRPDAP